MEMPENLPDMEFDVAELVASTSEHLLPPSATTNKPPKLTRSMTFDRKRQRFDSALSSINLDLSDLNERLSSHNPLDQNRFGILGALADVDIGESIPVTNTKTSKSQENKNDKNRLNQIGVPPSLCLMSTLNRWSTN